jgi:hypothetical protein
VLKKNKEILAGVKKINQKKGKFDWLKNIFKKSDKEKK